MRCYQRLLPVLILMLGFSLKQQAFASNIGLEPFSARFNVIRDDIPLGTLDLRLELTSDGRYHYTSHTKPGSLIRWFITDEVHESSKGTYKDKQIIPESYSYLQSDGNKVRSTLLEFDWESDKVWTDSEGTRWAQTIEPGTHDKFSQQLALRLDLSGGAKSVSYPVADGGRIKTYRYRVAGKETIELPYGNLNCLKVKRSKGDSPSDFTIWVAPEFNFLPVKIERTRSKGYYTIELKEFIEKPTSTPVNE